MKMEFYYLSNYKNTLKELEKFQYPTSIRKIRQKFHLIEWM